MKCDFCGCMIGLTMGDTYCLEGRAVNLSIGNESGVVQALHYDDMWAACPECAQLYYADDWDALISRVMSSMGEDNNPHVDMLLRVTYSHAFAAPSILTDRIESYRHFLLHNSAF